MLGFLKKTIAVTILSVITLSPSLAKNGSECFMYYAQPDRTAVQFVCKDLSKERMTIKEIYEKGYRVVDDFTMRDVVHLIIEEQD